MTELSKNKVELFNRLFVIENNWGNVLYIHTPFCPRKCYYCIYSSKEPDSQEEVNAFYRDVLPRQIELYKPVLDNVVFDLVYFGGGTPTIVDAGTLENIYQAIPNFADIRLKITEASPFTITDEHIDLFHRWGFQYVSLGLQTLSERILKEQNRLLVEKDKLIHVVQRLEQYDIIQNIDLIFYLDSGELEDISYSKEDLDYLMPTLKPASITLHYNYMSKKSFEKRKAMIDTIVEMTVKYPEYQCVNSLLEPGDVDYDMKYHAEYRLMRSRKKFFFYMTSKLPESHAYGCNILALGRYQKYIPRYNYFYIYDFIDKYAYRTLLDKLESFNKDFIRIRNLLGLPPGPHVEKKDFFVDEKGKERFKLIVKEYGLPFYEFGKKFNKVKE